MATGFRAKVWVEKDGMRVSARSIMGLMLLAASAGEELTITAEGPDAEKALELLVKLVDGRFDEE